MSYDDGFNHAPPFTPFQSTGGSSCSEKEKHDGEKNKKQSKYKGWARRRYKGGKNGKDSQSSDTDDPSLTKTKSFNRRSKNFSDTHDGKEATIMLNQIQNYTGSPTVRFDRWIKRFDNIVAMSNWNDDEIINMLCIKMSGEAYDFLQDVMENGNYNYRKIKEIFQENFHGDEDVDFYQEKFEEIQRKPKENILNFAFRLKAIYQRAYPSHKAELPQEKLTQLRFLRQKFLQGLESELQNIVRHKAASTFEELVAITQKYAKRVQLNQHGIEKKILVNSISTAQKESLMLKTIEKHSDIINAIVTSLQTGNNLMVTEPKVIQHSPGSPHLDQRMDQLVEHVNRLGNFVKSTFQQHKIFHRQYQPPHQPNMQLQEVDHPLPLQNQSLQVSQQLNSSPQFGNGRRLCYSCRQRGHKIKDCPDRMSM